MLTTLRIDSDEFSTNVRHVQGGNGESAIEVVTALLPGEQSVLVALIKPLSRTAVVSAMEEGYLAQNYIREKFNLDPNQEDFLSIVGFVRYCLGRTQGNHSEGITVEDESEDEQ